ncbi:MAG: histidine phosphotransferase family protein [Alphaproteobacteria bacterium]|nr:histidine phosphotransferase family protein [Alphaproteobacteria bacterium]
MSTDDDDTAKPPAGMVKTILGTIVLLADALPRSGKILVEVGSKDGWEATISARGQRAETDGASVVALLGTGSTTELTTRTVIGAIVGMTARRFGLVVTPHSQPDLARVTLRPEG